MSGHSKWSNIKHRKGKNDALKAKITTKISREITVAVKAGGTDPTGNMRLKLALQKARENNIPKDNIQRAIDKGAGAGDANNYEEITYEGYGPGGAAILVEVMTDNRNRAASDVRLAVTRNGGTMADQGSVAFLFERKGVAEVAKTDGLTEDDVLMAVLDAGAEEVLDEGDVFTVVSAATDLPEIRKALDEAELEYNNDDPVFRPTMQVDLDLDGAKKFLKLADAVEELDDVQNVYSNANVSAEVIAQLEAE